jgi:hypothetical protein
LNSGGSKSSSRLQRLTSGQRTGRCPGLQTQVREDLLDHRLLQDGRDDLEVPPQCRRCCSAIQRPDPPHAPGSGCPEPAIAEYPLLAGTASSRQHQKADARRVGEPNNRSLRTTQRCEAGLHRYSNLSTPTEPPPCASSPCWVAPHCSRPAACPCTQGATTALVRWPWPSSKPRVATRPPGW